MKIIIKTFVLIFLLTYSCSTGHGQPAHIIDSLHHELVIADQDSNRVMIMSQICSNYQFNRPDSALFYGYKGMDLARQIKFPYGVVRIMASIGIAYEVLGNFSKSLQIKLQAIKIAEENNNVTGKAVLMLQLGDSYFQLKDYEKVLSLSREAKILFDSVHEFSFSVLSQTNIGKTYLKMNQLDSALYYCQLAYDNAVKLKSWALYFVLIDLGKIQIQKGNTDLALEYFRQSLIVASNMAWLIQSNFYIAQLYQQIGNPDSCMYYGKKSLEIAQDAGFLRDIIDASLLLSNVIETSDPKKALQYKNMAMLYKDSLYNLGKVTTLESFIDFDEQERQYELEAAKTNYNNRVQRLWIFSISGALISAVILALVLYRNNKNKQKANTVLREQKEEIQTTLDKLESTQSQLIQSEKMASLGELTAGIAHEIQNPLNFVNNFSEVNRELIEELREAVAKNDQDEANTILNDLFENEEKVIQHGKRAEGIVKNMLQHSRSSSGEKELTDINALCDEYLRLAYHGMRAKDKTFNAEYKLELDKSIPKILVVPQDIGRALLNLINNAFYTVSEKRKIEGNDYKPSVSLSTRRVCPLPTGQAGSGGGKGEEKIQITVKDNGEGIPEHVRDKIFQPFFTTKPTGQGTGLGLSLSYDIVKAHGGKLELNSKAEESTEFIIHIPVNEQS